MYCHNCGEKLDADSKFCPFCGEAKISKPKHAAMDGMARPHARRKAPEPVALEEYEQEDPVPEPLEGEIVERISRSAAGDTLRNIGGTFAALGVVAFIIFIIIVFIAGSVFLSEKLLPILTALVWPAVLITLFIFLPMAAFKKLRGPAAISIYVSSYVYGITAWLIGFIVTLHYWGILGVIIGLCLAGIGVVPLGVISSGLNADWTSFWTLLILAAVTIGSRILGAWLAENADE